MNNTGLCAGTASRASARPGPKTSAPAFPSRGAEFRAELFEPQSLSVLSCKSRTDISGRVMKDYYEINSMTIKRML